MGISKCKTGVNGFDEITGGGLPAQRVSLVTGNAGTGKTLFGLEFLARGCQRYNETGIFISFEENSEELQSNVAALDFGIEPLISDKKIILDCVNLSSIPTTENGNYDLTPLCIRIEAFQKQIHAKRLVIDTLDALLVRFKDQTLIRGEIHRLFAHLKTLGLTVVVTGEKEGDGLSRHSLEEFVSDCVVVLDHRVQQEVSTRRLRIVKFRGSAHGTNEYPFAIMPTGFFIYPISEMYLDYPVSEHSTSSGIMGLDEMLDNKGFYVGSTVLVTGTPGTGKTSVAASFVHSACARGEKAIYYSLEESKHQLIRNIKSIGIDLQQWVEQERLLFHSVRSTAFGLEKHLIDITQLLDEFAPNVLVIDAISNFLHAGSSLQAKQILLRIIDLLKQRKVTTLLTSLVDRNDESSGLDISSFIDSWITLTTRETEGERNRILEVIKSRGCAHSNKSREFLITTHGTQE